MDHMAPATKRLYGKNTEHVKRLKGRHMQHRLMDSNLKALVCVQYFKDIWGKGHWFYIWLYLNYHRLSLF